MARIVLTLDIDVPRAKTRAFAANLLSDAIADLREGESNELGDVILEALEDALDEVDLDRDEDEESQG